MSVTVAERSRSFLNEGLWDSRLLAAVIIWLVSATCVPAADRPNVLLIVTDDQRPDTIGAFGNRIIQTPNLDALARRGPAW